jgi:hypothetical protein
MLRGSLDSSSGSTTHLKIQFFKSPYPGTNFNTHGKALTIPVLKFLTHLKGLSHEMDLAFDDMYG